MAAFSMFDTAKKGEADERWLPLLRILKRHLIASAINCVDSVGRAAVPSRRICGA